MWVSTAQSVKLTDQNGKGGVSATEQATANEKRQVGEDLPCVADWNAVPDSAALSSCSFRLDRHTRSTGFRRSRTHQVRHSRMLRRCEP